jgi:hypothetical protein
MAYSKAKLKSNDFSISLFQPILNRKFIRQKFTYTDFDVVSFKHILISLISFLGIPNLSRKFMLSLRYSVMCDVMSEVD